VALVSDGSDTLSPSTAWGLRITIGATLALIAYGLAMAFGLRSARKILGIVRKAQPDQQAQAPELAKLTTRLRLTAVTVTLLLSLSLILMVAAARL
jgi:hypothetical protein